MKAIKVNVKILWRFLNKKWDEAGEIQRRIDDAKIRNQEICRFGSHRTWY